MINAPKTFYLKMMGVSPDEVAELHRRLATLPSLLPGEPPERCLGYGQHAPIIRTDFTELLSSKLNKDDGSYTIEIRIDAAIGCYIGAADAQGRDRLMLAPRVVLDHLLGSFDGLFPQNVELQRLPAKSA